LTIRAEIFTATNYIFTYIFMKSVCIRVRTGTSQSRQRDRSLML